MAAINLFQNLNIRGFMAEVHIGGFMADVDIRGFMAAKKRRNY